MGLEAYKEYFGIKTDSCNENQDKSQNPFVKFQKWSRMLRIDSLEGPQGVGVLCKFLLPLLALPDRCVHHICTMCSNPKGSVCIQIEVIYVCHIHIYSHKAAPPYQAKYIQEDSRTIMGPLLRTMSAAVSPEQRPSFEFCKKMAPPMLCSRLVVQDCSPSQATQYQHKLFYLFGHEWDYRFPATLSDHHSRC